jgi:Zn-dependent protease
VWAERHPQRAALMAAAGPAGNFMIAIVALILIKVGLLAGLFAAPDSANFSRVVVSAAGGEVGFVATLLSVMLMLNVLLGTFNLLPLPPLDGAAVASALVPEPLSSSMRQFGTNPMASTMGLLVAWQVFPAITNPLFLLVLRLVHPGASYGPG